MDTDRNLLFGVLALQADIITENQFVEACATWAARKGATLADVLIERGWISTTDRSDVERVLERKVRKHAGDARASLAATVGNDVRRALAALDDSRINESIAALGHVNGSVELSYIQPAGGSRERFDLLDLHAQGGIGRVWRARDGRIGRTIALKELLPRMTEDRRMAARFITEAQVTGQLEHPGIVPVHELVMPADDAQPFYTMRFVSGKTLSDAVRAFHAQRNKGKATDHGLKNLLRAFVKICDAIAYAHSRGVIHRDLKGANVVLGEFGEVVVLDWGMAKVMGTADVAESNGEPVALSTQDDINATVAGEVFGTPAYMAPEQAAGDVKNIGPATDVYGLGAILCETLTGTPPFPGSDKNEVLRQVQKESPPLPRLTWPDVPRALEAVCLKCLEKDPKQRYASAADVGREVTTWLDDEPVTAMKESASIRAGRWMRKHRTLTSSAIVLCTTTIFGLAIGLAAVENQRRQTVTQENETAKALALADRRFDMATGAFNEMVFGVQQTLGKRPGTMDLRRELLVSARPGLEQLLKETESARGVDHTLVTSYFRFGDLALMSGETTIARNEFQKANEIAGSIAEKDPSSVQGQRDLSISHNKLGDVLLRLGDAPAALEHYNKGFTIIERLAGNQPRNAQLDRDLMISFNNLGDVLMLLGDLLSATEHYRKALEIAERVSEANPADPQARHDLYVSLDKIGEVTMKMGKPQESLAYYRKCLDITTKTADADPNNVQWQYDLSHSFGKIGDAMLDLGDAVGAMQYRRKSLEISQTLADTDLKNVIAQRYLSVSLYKVGDLSLRLGHTDDALKHFQKCVDIDRRLAHEDPKDMQALRHLSIALNKLGELTLETGNASEALTNYSRCLEISQQIATADPKNAQSQRDLYIGHIRLGSVKLRLGDALGATEHFRKSLSITNELAKHDPTNAQAQDDLSISYQFLGNVSLVLGDVPAAVGYYRSFQEACQRLAENDLKNARAQRALGVSSKKLGDALFQLGDLRAVSSQYRKFLETSQRLADADPRNIEAQHDLSAAFDAGGDISLAMGNTDAAEEYYRKGLAIAERMTTIDPRHSKGHEIRGNLFCKLGDVAIRIGHASRAIDNCSKGLKFHQQLADADPNDAEAQFLLFSSLYKLSDAQLGNCQFQVAREGFEKAIGKLKQFWENKWISKNDQMISSWTYQQWLNECNWRIVMCAKAEQSIKDLGFVLKQPANEVPDLLDIRLRTLARNRDAVSCLATAEAMTGLAKTDADGLLATARLWSICAGLVSDQKDNCQAKAMQYLKRAVDLGYANSANLKINLDWEPLRQRDDFKALLSGLETKNELEAKRKIQSVDSEK